MIKATFRLALSVLPMAAVAIAAGAATQNAGAATYFEQPYFKKKVAAGKLPPIAKRLPDTPSVVSFKGTGKKPGRYGGSLKMLMARAKDTRMAVVYGYARLVAYTADYKLVPDILERFDVEEGRIFTLHLRKGHRWSDGKPFTTDDFRYWWDHVINNKILSRYGVPQALLVDSKKPEVEFIDKHTVRFTWEKPNPYFLPALAGPRPLYLYMPRHYIKKFHVDFASKKLLRKMTKKGKKPKRWAKYHRKRGRMYRFQNPKLPTLQPWIPTTKPPADRYVFVRNPYYHRVDENGRQLPYTDRLIFSIADSKIVAAKAGAGETDLQARYLRFTDFTFLKRGEERGKHKVFQWKTATGAQIALYPNLNHKDPVWRKLFQDVRFRRALSLGIDRAEINEVMYYGMADEGGNTVLPRSPLFKKRYRSAWAYFDLKKANALLDEIGLTKRDSDGYRLLPDGRPLEIILEAASEGSEFTDAMRLIKDSWQKLGIRLFPKNTRREMFRRRIYAGLTHVSMWSGIDYANVTASTPPLELAPTDQVQLQWSQWGLFYSSKGKSGERPTDPKALELIRLLHEWEQATSQEKRKDVWERMLKICAEQVYSIGIVGGVIQPVVVNVHLRNVPKEGVWAWDPGAHLGIYRPDTFWFAKKTKATH